MKTARYITEQIAWMGTDNPDAVEEVLKKWAGSIIDECAGSAQYTMETEWCPGAENELQQYPVLDRESILQVKRKL